MHVHLSPDSIYPFDARGIAKRFRHAAIFGALDALRAGETMRFVNDHDPHIPWARVDESAAAFTRQNAAVTLRRYPGFPHSVHPEAVSFARQLLETVGTSRG